MLRTPIYPEYGVHGARLVPFGAFELPVQFAGVLAEHEAVRSRGGLFDVSHMGRFELTGADVIADIHRLVTCDAVNMPIGRAKYAFLCTPTGGILDDLIVYRLEQERFALVVNAANRAADWEWIHAHVRQTTCVDRSDTTAMLALQGPAARATMAQALAGEDPRVAAMKSFHVIENVAIRGVDAPVTVARTGYTGEFGYECIVAAEHAIALWRALLAAGAPFGVVPAGLGARDVLRLEAGLPLYGQELTANVHAYEAQLDRFLVPNKTETIGYVPPVSAGRNPEQEQRLVGLVMQTRGPVPRTGYAVIDPRTERPIGHISSGCFSPSTGQNIAFAWIPYGFHHLDTKLGVLIRQQVHTATVVPTPFYPLKTTTKG